MIATTLQLIPSPELQPFVQQLWWNKTPGNPKGSREHVLPTGQMHLVFRLSGPALRVFKDNHDLEGQIMRDPVVGGTRSSFYVKELGEPVISIGAQLRPGAAQVLFGVSAAELAGHHTSLRDLWGSRAYDIFDQLATAPIPQQQLQILQTLLAERLPNVKELHPAVAQALEAENGQRVEDLVRSSCYSHRGFISIFKQATGLSPKRYARLMRFQKLLAAFKAYPESELTELALLTGYSDQAHMTREFREFAGVTPMQYRRRLPASPHHVLIGGR